MSDAVHTGSEAGQVTVHAGRHADDPIIYFTLVDFLVQLLFFGLFLFVVFQFGGGNEDEEQRWAKKSEWAVFDAIKSNLPFYKGMSELVPADSQEAMLKALQELKKRDLLEEFLKFAMQTDSPLEVIEYCAKEPARCRQLVAQCEAAPEACGRFAAADEKQIKNIMKAFGSPPCIDASPPPSLFSIIGYGDGRLGGDGYFKVLKINNAGEKVLREAGIRLSAGQQISRSEALSMFASISRGRLNCVHYVDYIAESDSETMRGIIAESFAPRVMVLDANGVPRPRRIKRE